MPASNAAVPTVNIVVLARAAALRLSPVAAAHSKPVGVGLSLRDY